MERLQRKLSLLEKQEKERKLQRASKPTASSLLPSLPNLHPSKQAAVKTMRQSRNKYDVDEEEEKMEESKEEEEVIVMTSAPLSASKQ